MAKLNNKRWIVAGESATLERGPVTIFVDKTESHPYRGVYVTSRDHSIDVDGNPMGLRAAPYDSFKIAVNNGFKT
jgi:hypothetical protein